MASLCFRHNSARAIERNSKQLRRIFKIVQNGSATDKWLKLKRNEVKAHCLVQLAKYCQFISVFRFTEHTFIMFVYWCVFVWVYYAAVYVCVNWYMVEILSLAKIWSGQTKCIVQGYRTTVVLRLKIVVIIIVSGQWTNTHHKTTFIY